MNNLLRKLSFLAIAFLVSTNVPAFSAEKKSRRVSIETIENLKLSGYNQDDGGELQWRLEAESADADPQTKSEDIKRTRWNLNKLSLFTFGKKGEVFAKMTSPAGQFNPEKREADSESEVEVRGENFTVRGKGWSWSGHGHENLIRVHRDVFVALPQESLTVRAKRLTIKGEDEQTELVFSGGVEVAYKDIFMTCETLEILVADSGSRARELGDMSGKAGWRNAVQRITGRGNVSVKRGATALSGNSAEFLPQKNLFYVRGRARLDDAAAQISVRGDEAVGEIEQNFVEIIATQPNEALPQSPVAVSVEMPSLTERRKNAPTAAFEQNSGRSVVSGKRMTVSLSEAQNVISLFENVRMTDRDISIDADKLVVTTDPSGTAPLLDVREQSDASLRVRSAVAEGRVTANYAGRILNCERADVLPQKKRITLSGTPKVVSPQENSSLSGDRVEVFLDRDVIEVFSEESSAANRKRVEVRLPGFSELSDADKKTPGAISEKTKISGDHLTLTRGDELSTFDISGNVVLASAGLGGSCRRILVFADSESLNRSGSGKTSAKKSGLSQIRKIIADGDVALRQNGYELSGGRATITPAVSLKEWVADDLSAADGEMPGWVVIEPDADTGTRPRITFPGDATGTQLAFALPVKSSGKKPIAAPKKPGKTADLPLTKKKEKEVAPAAEPSKKSYLESDSMELIAGKARARFFLRGEVILATEGGAHGMCENVEGLLAPSTADSKRFDAQKVVCRGDVRLAHDGSEGKGSILEIFPPENRAVLRGNAKIRDKSGVSLHPGNDRFVFDLKSRQLITGAAAGTGGDVPAQVSRPRIIIPKGSDRVFVIPKSVRNEEKK